MLKETFGSGGCLKKLLKVSLRKLIKRNFMVDLSCDKYTHTIYTDCTYIAEIFKLGDVSGPRPTK